MNNNLLKKSLDNESLKKITGFLYNMSLRMLWDPIDAEDAVQDILIKIIENIDKFKGESKIDTWIYRIAANHLLNIKNKRFKDKITFDDFSNDINIDYTNVKIPEFNEAEMKIYEEELRIGCTHALLQCLDKKHRIVFILNNIFGIDSITGSSILSITPENYRKQLSRATNKILFFMKNNCGLYNKNAKCSCRRRLTIAFEKNRIDKNNLIFIGNDSVTIKEFMNNMNYLDDLSEIYRSNPYYEIKENIIVKLKNILGDKDIDIIKVE